MEGIVINKTTEMIITPRRSIIVWLYNLKNLNSLKQFGKIDYVSKKMKYVIVYMNESDVETSLKRIKKLHFVRDIEISYRPDIVMDFDNRLGNKFVSQSKEQLSEFYEIEELSTQIKLADNINN